MTAMEQVQASGADPGWEQRLPEKLARLHAEDAQFRAAVPSADVTAQLHRPGIRLVDIVETLMRSYAERPALGQRRRDVVTDPVTGHSSTRLSDDFETVTYHELWTAAEEVAAAWAGSETPLIPGEFVCTIGPGSFDYAIVDLACIRQGLVSVPLASGAPATQIAQIFAETQPRVVAVAVEGLETALEAAALAGITPEYLLFDHEPRADDQRVLVEAARARAEDEGSHVDDMDSLRQRGRTLPVPAPSRDGDENRLVTLIYTSGSTGAPKGAMYTERLVAGMWRRQSLFPTITVHFLPLSHVGGRTVLSNVLGSGGTNYFSTGSDMTQLLRDYAAVRPTQMQLVPRVCEVVNQRYVEGVSRARQRSSDPAELAEAIAEIRRELREDLLGGRVLTATYGSAPLSPDIVAVIESVLDLHLVDTYGATETGPMTMDGHILSPPITDYKLVDVPELGYYRTDRPHPRGELAIKSATVIPGYYKRPDVTAAVFDDEGFYHTGDIMAEVEPGRLVYLDRRNNVLKLSQGEFVTVAAVEAVFARSPFIQQIYVYGNSTQSFLLAVVVPDPEATRDLADDAAVKSAIRASIQQIAEGSGLRPYEIPRDFIIDRQPWTQASGLLTGAGKIARPALAERYRERLEKLYVELAEGRTAQLDDLRRGVGDRPVIETVIRAVAATLGIPTDDVDPASRFVDLGGDSMAAVSFTDVLSSAFGIEVPSNVVLNPTGDLERIAAFVSAAVANDVSTLPSPGSVHADLGVIRADELKLDRFIPADILRDAPTLPVSTEPFSTVLVTGANGYLGRFLCLEWLERVARRGGTVIAMARGRDAAEARARIVEAFASDPGLLSRFTRLAADHLEVVAGDLGTPGLGLDADTWGRLASEVGLIVHPAAHVNHILPYQQLFAANVGGTAEIIRLGLTERIKAINFVSTIGVALSPDQPPVEEDEDIRQASPRRVLDGSYAMGYAASKWGGEVLLREAHDLCGMPVTVIRCNMLLAHRHAAGQFNAPDVFSRWLLSLAATGVAPRSFYRGDGSRAHYDGLPVDFTAAAIASLGEHTAGFHTVNAVNPHDDGISMDTFVDWMTDAGYPIERIDDYGDWRSRVEAAMRALPDEVRQHSMLALMDAFAEPAEALAGSMIPSEGFKAAVQSGCAGEESDIPHLSRTLIEKYLADFARLGLLAPPDATGGQ